MNAERFDPADDSADAARSGVDSESLDGLGPDALGRLRAELEELAEYARLYLAARGDAIIASMRRLGLWIAAALLGMIVVSAALASAAVIGILGVAQLLGELLGGLWAGYIVTGFGLLLIATLAMLAAIIILRRKFRKQTVRKYARRHEQQKARFGHDVIQRGST